MTPSRAWSRDGRQPKGFLGRGVVAGSRASGGERRRSVDLENTTLDKPYANEIDPVTWHWSGKHKDVVKGINLLTLLWRGSSEQSSGERSGKESSEGREQEPHVPCDFRLYEKDGKTKNEHFREMAETASDRGLVGQPQEDQGRRMDLLYALEEKSEGQPGRHLQPASSGDRHSEGRARGAPEGPRLRKGPTGRLHRRRRVRRRD